MTTRLSTISAVALAAALAACTASAPPPRVAMMHGPALRLHDGAARSTPDCGYDDGGFDTREDAMKLPEDAFKSCLPQ
ncbi:MAG TPA: hypothetical protein VF502_00020 [Stellaceae bacterium]